MKSNEILKELKKLDFQKYCQLKINKNRTPIYRNLSGLKCTMRENF